MVADLRIVKRFLLERLLFRVCVLYISRRVSLSYFIVYHSESFNLWMVVSLNSNLVYCGFPLWVKLMILFESCRDIVIQTICQFYKGIGGNEMLWMRCCENDGQQVMFTAYDWRIIDHIYFRYVVMRLDRQEFPVRKIDVLQIHWFDYISEINLFW